MAGFRGLRRGRRLLLVLVAVLAVGCGIAGIVVSTGGGNGAGARKGTPSVSLAVARRQLESREPSMTSVVVRSAGGFQAICYDQHGHLVFLRPTAGGWHEAAQSTYPPDSGDGPPSYDEHGVHVRGALRPGMSDAVFIVTGPFSGDGTGNAVAYGNGPDGWGLLTQDGARRLRSSGTGAGSGTDTGLYFAARFTGGFLETAVDSGVFSSAFGSGFPIRRRWSWSEDHFALAGDSIVTASTATAPTGEAPSSPRSRWRKSGDSWQLAAPC